VCLRFSFHLSVKLWTTRRPCSNDLEIQNDRNETLQNRPVLHTPRR
jgi:hypothetical protein